MQGVLRLFDKLAQRYPHYPVMHNNRPDLKFRASQKFPFDWDSGKWGNFHDEIPRYLVWAYDMVHDSDEFEKLSNMRLFRMKKSEKTFRARLQGS